MRLYRSTANFTKVEKIAIQWIALSGLRTTDRGILRYLYSLIVMIIFLRASRPARTNPRWHPTLEEYMKDIQGKGGSLPSTGPVRQDEPVSSLSYLFFIVLSI